MLAAVGRRRWRLTQFFNEGRRQFIETQSVYTRQFFQQLPRAEAELIEGLQPTLAIDQRSEQNNPRSTVGTITEIYDYLRVLMARCGDVYCSRCNTPIQQQSLDQICSRLMKFPERSKVMVLAQMVRGRKGEHLDVFEKIRSERLVRVRVDGEICDIEQVPLVEATKVHTIEAVTDRIVIRDGIESRLVESLELAVRLGDGVAIVSILEPNSNDWNDIVCSTKYACPNCDISYAEVEPRTFSFNSPYGACQSCMGFGQLEGYDIAQVIPDRNLTIQEGAVIVWREKTKAIDRQISNLQPLADSLGVDLANPLSLLDDERLNALWMGADKIPGIKTILEKERATTADVDRLDLLEGLRSEIACETCNGSRLNQLANSVFLDGLTITEITNLPISESQLYLSEIQFSDHRQEISETLVTQILHRLKFLNEVGVGYLSLDRSGRSLSGGEHQRVRLATAIGTGLTNVCFVLDEPSIGLHQRDNNLLIEAICRLRESGNSVIVVEHDEDMMRVADYLIDVGPGAGKHGGEIVAAGTPGRRVREREKRNWNVPEW